MAVLREEPVFVDVITWEVKKRNTRTGKLPPSHRKEAMSTNIHRGSSIRYREKIAAITSASMVLSHSSANDVTYIITDVANVLFHES